MKTSFLLHKDSLCILEKMTDEQAGKFIKIIYQYQKTKELPEMDLLMDMAITPFINQFLRDEIMYEKISEDRKVAGAKGGKKRVENLHKKKKNNKLEANQANASNFKQTKQSQANEANQADSDSDSDSDKENDSDSKKDSNYLGDKSQKKTYKEFSQQDFIDELEPFKSEYPKELLNNFYKYWKEKSPGGKMRFQLEKTWETELRLENWQRNNNQIKINGTHQQSVNGNKNRGADQLLQSIKQEFAARGKNNLGE